MMNIGATANGLVPVIRKSHFDDEATEFLAQYCPEALEKPIPTPIVDIAKHKMGLTVITDVRLSEDFSLFGQMCFTGGLATIYDKDEDEYRDMLVKRGTMFVDPDTYFLRNLGCMNNTVAHECFHWYKHRNYHILQSVLDGTQSIACRCPSNVKDELFSKTWTDEDWMEWQANGIAPRILMPKQTVHEALDKLVSESKSNAFISAGLMRPTQWIIEQLANLYQVSKTSAGIRINELGISL